MVTDRAPAPALQVFTTNSDAAPEGYEQHPLNILIYLIQVFRMKVFNVRVHTCGSSLQARSEGGHQAGISDLSRFSHSDFERAAGDVAAVETNIDGVNAVLSWDEPDGVLICGNRKTMKRIELCGSPEKKWTQSRAVWNSGLLPVSISVM